MLRILTVSALVLMTVAASAQERIAVLTHGVSPDLFLSELDVTVSRFGELPQFSAFGASAHSRDRHDDGPGDRAIGGRAVAAVADR
jgi:hypothetical protein